MFISATKKAAVHLGPDYEENLRTTKNTDVQQVKTLFDISQSLILDHRSEIYGISTIEWNTTPWIARGMPSSRHDHDREGGTRRERRTN